MSEVTAVQVPLPLKNWVKGTNGAMAALSIGAGGVLAYLAFPSIVAFLQSLAIAFGWLIAIGCMTGATMIVLPTFIYLWPRIRRQQKVWALAIADQMVKKEPVRWSQIYIDDMKQKLNTLFGGTQQAVKSLNTAKRKRDENVQLRDEANRKSQVAFRAGKKPEAIMWDREAKRKDAAIARSERWIKMLELIVSAMKKMSENLQIRITDQENELNSYIDEYETAKDVEPGIRAGMNALSPDEDMRSIKEAAVKEMTSKADGMYAELELTMEAFQPIISAQDLDDAAAFDKMTQAFAKWEKSADSALLGPGGKQQLLAGTTDTLQSDARVAEPVLAQSGSNFSKLIDGK